MLPGAKPRRRWDRHRDRYAPGPNKGDRVPSQYPRDKSPNFAVTVHTSGSGDSPEARRNLQIRVIVRALPAAFGSCESVTVMDGQDGALTYRIR